MYPEFKVRVAVNPSCVLGYIGRFKNIQDAIDYYKRQGEVIEVKRLRFRLK